MIMKKFLSVLIALAMVLSMLPIAATAETTEINGQMKVKIEGERMYVRTYHNETYDLVQTFRVNGDRIGDNGIPCNEPFDFHEAGLMLKDNASYTAFDKKLANGGDDIAPFKTNSSYIGANHGQSHAILIKATNHGKTYADLGARYLASNIHWNLIQIRDKNNLLFISDNGRGEDYGKYFFEGAHKLPVGTVMTYESDGVDTEEITVESATGAVQIEPSTKTISVNMYAVTDGVKTPMNEANDLMCDSIIVEEHYQIMNPALIAQALRDNKPEGGYTESQLLDIGTPMIDYKVTYTILPDGAVLHAYDHEILDNLSFDFYGGHQYIQKYNGFEGNVKRYIPKIKPFTVNGKYYDFTEPYNLTADKDFLGGGEKWVTSELWENPNSMPDRTVEYFYDENDDLKAGFVGGYLPILDAEPATKVAKSSRAIYIYNSKKSYPILVDKLAFNETGTKNQHIRAVSYTKYNDVTDEDISYYTINYGTDSYIYIDCHEIAEKDIAFAELGIKGNSLEVVEKSDNVKYLKNVDSINVNMPSGTYGYLVLKSENNAYVSITDTAECESSTATTESNGDLVFNTDSSATYDIGASIPSGTYAVKANALATSAYTFSATDGTATFSDTKSGNGVLNLGSFTFTNGQENTITISCTAGSNVTLDEIILEKVQRIDVFKSGKTEFSIYNDSIPGNSSFKTGSADTVAIAFENGLEYNKDGSGYGVFDASGHVAEYLIKVEESGLYDLSFVTGRTDAEYIISVDDTKYIGSSDNGNKASLGTADENLEAYSDFVCGMYLAEGEHKIKIELKSGSAYLYAGIFERVTDAISLSTENENNISAVGKYNSAVYNDTLEVYPDSGYAAFRNGHKFYYLVDLAENKDYTLYAITSGAAGSATVKDITNDTVLYSGTFGSVTSGESAKTKAGLIELKKGKMLLEITSTGNTANFYGFVLEPASYKEISAEGTTEFSFYKDHFKDEKNWAEGGADTTAEAFQSGLSMDKEGSGYAVFNASEHYASYKFEVKEAGIYDLSVATGRSDITFDIAIDDEAYTGEVTAASKAELGGSDANFDVYKSNLCSVYLKKGIHKIIFTRASGAAYLYAWFVERNPDIREVSAEDEAMIFAVTDYCDATYNGNLEVKPGGSSSVTGDFADYWNKGFVTFRKGHKFRYEIEIKRAGNYELSVIMGGADKYGASAGTITNYATGEVLYSGKFGDVTGGMYKTVKYNHGTIYLDEGITAIEIESTGGTQYFYGFTLKCVKPEVTMTNASGETITSIVDGTMNFSVNLGNIPYDDVYIAIYEKSANKNKMCKITKATVSDGVATGTITDIDVKPGYTYYAKVFSWDDARLLGFSYSTLE